MNELQVIVIIGVALVVLYEFTNGFHDAADMVATAIASMTMTPRLAILLVCFFTFLGPLVGGVAVADTIGEFVDVGGASKVLGQSVAIAGLLSAITFNFITWKLSLPSSSSVSLTSGLLGAGLYGLGTDHIRWGITDLSHGSLSGFMTIIVGLFLSPVVGFIVGFCLIKFLRLAFRRLTIKSRKLLIFAQGISISWLALSHGMNDAQKGMGVIAMLLLSSGVYSSFVVPFWVILLCSSAITIGTMFGGWNIIKTVGFGIYRVRLIHSFADQLGSAFVILSSSMFGAPVSTTSVVITTLMGVGAGERPKHVRWNMAQKIVFGWLMNIPTCIIFGMIYFIVLKRIIP